MATLLLSIFIVLHITTAAAWFGMGLRLATQARTALTLDPIAARALVQDTQRTVRFMGIFIVLTLLFAFTAFGLSSLSHEVRFHISMLLIVVLVAVQFALIAPAWKKLYGALTATPAAADTAEAARKRIAMSTGIGHLLWFTLLVLMFWDRLAAGFTLLT